MQTCDAVPAKITNEGSGAPAKVLCGAHTSPPFGAKPIRFVPPSSFPWGLGGFTLQEGLGWPAITGLGDLFLDSGYSRAESQRVGAR